MHDICPSSSKNSHIYIKCLHEACVILGGEHKLAEYLGVPVTYVAQWLYATADLPDDMLEKIIDLLSRL